MATTYHGPTPVTDSDISMAKTHLKDTLKIKKQELALNNSKIADHAQAAADTNNPKSAAYNQGHIQGHIDDNKTIKGVIADRQASMKTLKNLKPVYDKVKGDNMADTTKKTGSFQGKSNDLGGGGRAAQLKAKGLSGGLIGYIGRKKYGASAMAKMAAAGKK